MWKALIREVFLRSKKLLMKVKKNSLKKKREKGNSKKHYEFAHRFYGFVSLSLSEDKILSEAHGWNMVNVLPGQILTTATDYISRSNLHL